MTKTEVRLIVEKIIQTNDTNIQDNSELSEFGLTSLDMISLVVELEREYGIEVLDSDLIFENFNSINSIYSTLKKYIYNDEVIYKCVITDCDGVLWRGIAGEDGADKAFFDANTREFVKLLRDLKKRGVLLAICSRNDLKNISEMLNNDASISLDDFFIIETDCREKSSSIHKILHQLGFLPENIIFVDDSDFELEIVSTVLPTLKCIKAENNNKWISGLSHLFDNLSECSDLDRTEMYRLQKEREKLHVPGLSTEEYNHILKTSADCRIGIRADIERLEELSHRANRFNITGIRYSQEELRHFIETKEKTIFVIEASDKFGDMGIVGMSVVDGSGTIESFIISCRVFGRDFESLLLEKIKSSVKEDLVGVYVSTGKNDYCKDFYLKHGVYYEAR